MTERTRNAGERARGENETGETPTITARAARQGRVVLDGPVRRAVFLGGLVGLVVVALVLALAGA